MSPAISGPTWTRFVSWQITQDDDPAGRGYFCASRVPPICHGNAVTTATARRAARPVAVAAALFAFPDRSAGAAPRATCRRARPAPCDGAPPPVQHSRRNRAMQLLGAGRHTLTRGRPGRGRTVMSSVRRALREAPEGCCPHAARSLSGDTMFF